MGLFRTYPYTFPKFFRRFYPNATFVGRDNKAIYLTFDDGPTPVVTEWVLSELEKHNAKATFFLIGDNADRHPEIVDMLKAKGHTVGHHTQNHLNGFNTGTPDYFKNVEAVPEAIKTKWFRPPYGRLKPSQYKQLEKKYQVVLWSVISGDFDTSLSGEQCANIVLKRVNGGDVIVFHDSQKALERLEVALPIVLETLSKKGFSFKAL